MPDSDAVSLKRPGTWPRKARLALEANEPVGVMAPAPPESAEEKDGVVCEAWLGGLLRHYRTKPA